jgi:hypothetical protein
VSTPAQWLEAQRAHFASDDHIRREVAVWADATPQERLAELAAMSTASEFYLQRLDDAVLGRMRALRDLPPDTVAILEGIRRASQ